LQCEAASKDLKDAGGTVGVRRIKEATIFVACLLIGFALSIAGAMWLGKPPLSRLATCSWWPAKSGEVAIQQETIGGTSVEWYPNSPSLAKSFGATPGKPPYWVRNLNSNSIARNQANANFMRGERYFELAGGWPMRSVWMGGWAGLGAPIVGEFDGSPSSPIWPGIVVNGLTWSAALALSVTIAIRFVKHFFARRDGCHKCGYDLSATPAGAKCPECGA